jgi:hypothetical protein
MNENNTIPDYPFPGAKVSTSIVASTNNLKDYLWQSLIRRLICTYYINIVLSEKFPVPRAIVVFALAPWQVQYQMVLFVFIFMPKVTRQVQLLLLSFIVLDSTLQM